MFEAHFWDGLKTSKYRFQNWMIFHYQLPLPIRKYLVSQRIRGSKFPNSEAKLEGLTQAVPDLFDGKTGILVANGRTPLDLVETDLNRCNVNDLTGASDREWGTDPIQNH